MQNRIWIAILLTIFGLFYEVKQSNGLFFGSKTALALETPNFPSCLNPQGTIKVSYNEGIHGIVGDTSQYTGKDTVYQLDNGNLAQCFCSTNGQGIQTNWWKVSSLDPEQLRILKNAGWIFVPNGTLWGLEETSYFVKNSNYNCGPSEGIGGGEVLGLASTGGNFLPFVLAIVGALSLVAGLLLSKKTSER